MRSRHDGTGRARSPLSFLCGTHRTDQDTRPIAEQGPAAEPEVVVVGAHGGAGTTTIAMLLRPAWDMGTALIDGTGHAPVNAYGRPLVVVCEGTVPAARDATTVVTALHAGGQHVTALVVVADGAGPEPEDATARIALLRGRVGGIVAMPFIPGLRLVDDPQRIALPAKALRALAQIRELADARPDSHHGLIGRL